MTTDVPHNYPYSSGHDMPLASNDAATARAKFAASSHALPSAAPAHDKQTEPGPRGPTLPSRGTEVLSEDTGPRVIVRCCLPNICASQHRQMLEQKLVETFGGFTSYPMRGGWKADDGRMMLEHGMIYEVSVVYRYWPVDAACQARNIFRFYGRMIGETDVHVEFWRCEAQHAHVNETPRERRNRALRERDAANG